MKKPGPSPPDEDPGKELRRQELETRFVLYP